MNRAERRRMKKKVPGYRKALKQATAASLSNFEETLKKKWAEDEDSSLSYGEHEAADESGDDEIYDY